MPRRYTPRFSIAQINCTAMDHVGEAFAAAKQAALETEGGAKARAKEAERAFGEVALTAAATKLGQAAKPFAEQAISKISDAAGDILPESVSNALGLETSAGTGLTEGEALSQIPADDFIPRFSPQEDFELQDMAARGEGGEESEAVADTAAEDAAGDAAGEAAGEAAGDAAGEAAGEAAAEAGIEGAGAVLDADPITAPIGIVLAGVGALLTAFGFSGGGGGSSPTVAKPVDR